jgi:hypothetical protein
MALTLAISLYGVQDALEREDGPYLSQDGCTLLEHPPSMFPNFNRQFNVVYRNPIAVIVTRH